MSESLVFAIMIIGLFGLMALGLPIVFTMAGVAIFGTLAVWGVPGLYSVVTNTYGSCTEFIYIAVPLFLLMANCLQGSGMADDMYEVIFRWTGRLRGGLAIGTVIICAIFGAMAGVSSVATVTMGTIALPSMMKRGYDKSMILGAIMAGGALGILIPPSIIMIVYGGVSQVSIGKLFMAGVMPGIMLTIFYCIYIGIKCLLDPKAGPPCEERFTWLQKLVILKGVALPIILVVVVMGSIYMGIATPTEAAGVGAIGSIICMIVYGRFTIKSLTKALIGTVKTNAMVMWIIVGAACFSQILTVMGIQDQIQQAITGWDVNRWWIVIAMMATFFVMGMFLSPAAIVTMVGPIFVPIIVALGFDPLWFGILFVINMEMGYLTPPFGFNLFILKGVTPPEITMADIYKSIAPYILIMILGLIVCMILPEIVLWLPSQMVAK